MPLSSLSASTKAASDITCLLQEVRVEVHSSGKKARRWERTRFLVHEPGDRSEELRVVVVEENYVLTPKSARVAVSGDTGVSTRYELSDFVRIPAKQRGVFVSDDEVLAVRVPPLVAGDTLSIETEYELDPFTGFPVHVMGTGEIRCRRAVYRVRIHEKLTPRFRSWNGAGNPAEDLKKGHRIWTWEQSNLDPVASELLGPPPEDLLPAITIGISRIAWGPSQTWEELGATYWKKVKDNVTAELDLTEGEPVDRGLGEADACLAWVQERVRYVAIILGKGGYVPHRSRDVHRNQYGDCKDMSALLVSLLNQRAAKAHMALVRTRPPAGWKGELLPSLRHFNHAIVYAEEGSLWLDATDSEGTARSPRSDIQGSPALVVQGKSAGLWRIPLNPPERNSQQRTIRLIEGEDGWRVQATLRLLGTEAQALSRNLDARETARELLWEGLPYEEWSARGVWAKIEAFAPDSVRVSSVARLSPSRMQEPLIPPWGRGPDVLNIFRERERQTDIYWPFLVSYVDSVIIEPRTMNRRALPDTSWQKHIPGLSASFIRATMPESVILVRRIDIPDPVLPVEHFEDAREIREGYLRWSTRRFQM